MQKCCGQKSSVFIIPAKSDHPDFYVSCHAAKEHIDIF